MSLVLALFATEYTGAIERCTAAEPPNVLFIAIDDLNDWIGCLGGHPQAATPNMDRLAARGVLFANAHCAAPACNPSRAAVFSGQLPSSTGVWSNDSPKLSTQQPDVVQLPSAFEAAGYHTMGTGKLSGDKRTRYVDSFNTEQRWSPFTKQEVEYSADELASKGSANPMHLLTDSLGRSVVLPRNRMPSDRAPQSSSGESFDWGPWDLPDEDFGDTRITDWAIQKLQQGSEKPFFLGVGYYRPHIPLFAPSRFFARFSRQPGALPPVKNDDLADLSQVATQWALAPITAGSHATVVAHDQWVPAVEAYLACVSYVDNEIGRLIDALDATGASNNTLIVLWSDHGWHLGEKQHWGKWTGWERATRVPLIIVPPKDSAATYAEAGSVCDQPVSLIDLFPTLAEICALPTDSQLDGKSLVPLLVDPQLETDRTIRTQFNPGNVSLRTKRWRYIRYAGGEEELYDLRADPNEWTNLAQRPQHPQSAPILKHLRREAN